jgi:tape measure domain-containing protein
MATDVERLVVSLEASITKYERTMQRAIGVTNKTMREIEKRQTTMVQRMNSGFAGIQRGVVTAFASAAALRGAAALVDASTRIENSLKVVGLEGEELARVYDRLFQSAQKNMAPLETLTTLYSRLGLAQKELGVTNEQLLSFTDNVALALRVQGTTADEARGALIQLSQAMGSGIVRAEEFNSVVEGAPSILRAAAAGLKEANGSVAQLRKLVIDGKLSSEAFFHAFEAGSVILKDQVANAEMTVSQGFVRLQTVLIDTAGKFDNATNASGRVGGALAELAAWIEQVGNKADENAPAINRFLDWISKAGNDLGNSMFQGTVREFEAIGSAVEQVSAGFDRYGSSVTDAELATAQAEQALVNFAANGASQFGELAPVVQDFIQQLLEGRGTAESAAVAIEEIGKAGDFGDLMSRLGGLVDTLFSVRTEAVATAAAVAAAAAGRSSTDNIADQRAEQLGNRPKAVVKPVSLSDYAAPEKPGSGGSKRSPGERYADSLADYQRRIDMMREETELQRGLSPLINDYGFAIERLRAQQELENAAKKAGIELGPEQRAEIAALADGYATATAEAAKLAEAQSATVEQMDNLRDAAQDALQTIIDGFIEGKSAGDIFADVLANIGKQLISMGMGSLFGGGSGGGYGLLGKLFGFANGGIAAHGRPKMFANGGVSRSAAIFGEAGPEAAVPLPDGRRIPVDLRMPSIPQGGGATSISMPVTINAPGADATGLADVVDQVRKLRAEMPTIAKKAMRDNKKYGQG